MFPDVFQENRTMSVFTPVFSPHPSEDTSVDPVPLDHFEAGRFVASTGENEIPDITLMLTQTPSDDVPLPDPIDTNRMRVVDRFDMCQTPVFPKSSSCDDFNIFMFRLVDDEDGRDESLISLNSQPSSACDRGSSLDKYSAGSRVSDEMRHAMKKLQDMANKSAFLNHAADSMAAVYSTAQNQGFNVSEHSTDSTSGSVAPVESNEDRWSDKLEELKGFIREHGHTRVPVRYKPNLSLSKWAKRQRYQYKLKQEGKKSTLSDKREQKLDELGFLWDIRQTVWEERYDELVEFQRDNGHCNVPINYKVFPKLGTWTKCQRRQYKLYEQGLSSAMSPERARKLQSVGILSQDDR